MQATTCSRGSWRLGRGRQRCVKDAACWSTRTPPRGNFPHGLGLMAPQPLCTMSGCRLLVAKSLCVLNNSPESPSFEQLRQPCRTNLTATAAAAADFRCLRICIYMHIQTDCYGVAFSGEVHWLSLDPLLRRLQWTAMNAEEGKVGERSRAREHGSSSSLLLDDIRTVSQGEGEYIHTVILHRRYRDTPQTIP